MKVMLSAICLLRLVKTLMQLQKFLHKLLSNYNLQEFHDHGMDKQLKLCIMNFYIN